MTFPFQQWQHILKIDHASIPWQHNSSLIKTFKTKENTKGDSKLKILLISSCHSWPLLSVSLLFARMAVHHTCFTACFLPRVIESNQACNWLVWKLEQKKLKKIVIKHISDGNILHSIRIHHYSWSKLTPIHLKHSQSVQIQDLTEPIWSLYAPVTVH